MVCVVQLKETPHASCRLDGSLAPARAGWVFVIQQQQPFAAGEQHHRRTAGQLILS
jgi:hypothetical protein